jgi:hypothetical protein
LFPVRRFSLLVSRFPFSISHRFSFAVSRFSVHHGSLIPVHQIESPCRWERTSVILWPAESLLRFRPAL